VFVIGAFAIACSLLAVSLLKDCRRELGAKHKQALLVAFYSAFPIGLQYRKNLYRNFTTGQPLDFGIVDEIIKMKRNGS
jgi:hypothetical protein